MYICCPHSYMYVHMYTYAYIYVYICNHTWIYVKHNFFLDGNVKNVAQFHSYATIALKICPQYLLKADGGLSFNSMQGDLNEPSLFMEIIQTLATLQKMSARNQVCIIECAVSMVVLKRCDCQFKHQAWTGINVLCEYILVRGYTHLHV